MSLARSNKLVSEMTYDDARYIVRRKPVTPWEVSLNREAYRVLGRAGETPYTVEMELGRPLSADERAWLAAK